MPKKSGIILLIILVLPLLTWLLLRQASHKAKEVRHIYTITKNPDGSLDSLFTNVKAFSLQDQAGQTFTQASLQNKVSVFATFYPGCTDECAPVNKFYSLMQEKFLDTEQFQFFSVNIRPGEGDIGAYARQVGTMGNKWHLLTGDSAEVDRFLYENLFPTVKKRSLPDGKLDLVGYFRLTDRFGRFRGKNYRVSDRLDVDSLEADLYRLELEFAQNENRKKIKKKE